MQKRIDTRGYRAAYVATRRAATKELLTAIRTESGCVVCGEADAACLDFHHRDPSTKRFSLAVGQCHSRKEKSVLAEIEKCTVLCSNCHRKFHAAER